MGTYRNILLATDFCDYAETIADRAKALAEANQAQLGIVHIFDNLPIQDLSNDFIIPSDFDLQQELLKTAAEKLRHFAARLQIPESRQYLEIGNPGTEIAAVATREHADLIVLGSHGRSGLALLLGSTANSVLHHAQCDVLAIRIK